MWISTSLKWFSIVIAIAVLAGCGESEEVSEADFVGPDNTQEVLDYYAANPEFFTFATIDDLPKNLDWEDGSDLPDIGSPEAKKGGTQYDVIQDFPRTFRLVGPDSNGSFRTYLMDDVTVPLASQHPNFPGRHYPGLATSWAVVPETATVYAKLNPDARWSDGEPITADDFLFMFYLYRSPHILSPWFNNNFTTQFTNITKYDDYTLSITQPASKPNLHYRILTLRPMPQHFFREFGEDFVDRYQWRFWPTTGPYVVHDKDVKKGQSVALTRNKEWWAKDNKYYRNRYNPDRIHISVVRDPAKQFETFKKGDHDMFNLNVVEYWYDKLPDDDPDVAGGYIHKSEFYNRRPRPIWGLWLNMAQPMMSDRKIRLGIHHATNWQLVIDKFYRGDYQRLKTAQDGYGEFSHPTLEGREYDIDKAASYFAAAGYTKRGPDGILVNAEGQRLSVTMTTGYVRLQDVLTILKEEARKAGLEFRLEVLDSTSSFKKAREKKTEILYGGLSPFVEMYPRFWESQSSFNAYDRAFLDDGSVNPDRKVKPQTNNLESFADPEMDRLIELYRASSDKQEMIGLAHRMYEIQHEMASFSPGAYRPYFRKGYWRWVKWPADFNVKVAAYPEEYYVHWIDTDIKKETLAARKEGKTFPPEIRVFDQYRD
jgi:microcin C transport system substrate-binding protein